MLSSPSVGHAEPVTPTGLGLSWSTEGLLRDRNLPPNPAAEWGATRGETARVNADFCCVQQMQVGCKCRNGYA